MLGASAYSNVIRLERRVLVAEDGVLTAFAIIAVPGAVMTPSENLPL